MIPFDSDRYDAEILVDRLSTNHYDKDAVAELLGVNAKTVLRRLSHKMLPRPAMVDGGRTERHIWSRRQLVEMLLANPPWKEEEPAPIHHGEPRGYKAHKKRGEDACQACKDAHQAYNKRYDEERRIRRAQLRRAMAK